MSFSLSDTLLSGEVQKWIVLIVDDTPDNLAIAETVLSFSGAQVITATTGAEAIELAQAVLPTVILLDLRMPAMDGWEVYRTLRHNPTTKGIPIIALTAYAMKGDRQRILAAGFNGYISKPYDPFSLVPEIRAILTSVNQIKPTS